MAKALADLLVEQGVIDEATRQRAVHAQASSGAPLPRVLIDMAVVSEQQIVAAVARELGVPFYDTSAGAVDPSAAALLPRETAQALSALPVGFGPAGTLLVAMADPADATVTARIAELTRMEVLPGLTVRSDLEQAIEHLAGAVPPATVASPVEPEGELLAYEQDSMLDLDAALVHLLEVGGSDLHLTSGRAPSVRVNGELRSIEGLDICTPPELQKALYGILTQKQREAFENDLELDLSYTIPGRARFRVNIFQQRGSMGAVLRVIPFEIKSIEELGIPAQVLNFAHLPRGFVLVTGPTGSGKSTTLAGLIDVINRERSTHIMTVEDPIEFLHAHKKSLVNQRELGTDTHTFGAALKHVLRQDPDVILVGEMRDLETIQVALTAAETGHLVFGTLHTQDAPQTVDRIIDVFPPHQQEQIRVMLAGTLQGVVCQQLIKTVDGKGRVAACEVMVATSAIRNLIREGKTHQMYSSLQAGKQHGMVTMDQSLAELVIKGRVTYESALEKCSNVPDFNRLCGRA